MNNLETKIAGIFWESSLGKMVMVTLIMAYKEAERGYSATLEAEEQKRFGLEGALADLEFDFAALKKAALEAIKDDSLKEQFIGKYGEANAMQSMQRSGDSVRSEARDDH